MIVITENIKISLSILVAVIISVFIFFLVMISLPDDLFQIYQEFFSKDLGDGNKIFILGSSHVFAINPIIISEKLKQNNYDFDVYNLASPGDDFEERARSINMIIEKKPKIIIIGIEPRSFESNGRSITLPPESPLPNIPSFNKIFQIVDLGDKKGIFENPKFAIIRTISSPLNIDKINTQYTPFFQLDANDESIIPFTELNKIQPEYVAQINPIENNSNLISLRNFISELENNNIKVILFITPHSKIYLDLYPQKQSEIFFDIIDFLSKNNQVYSLYEKYSELNVWHDHTHLAVNKNSNFYSNDIADLIIAELKN